MKQEQDKRRTSLQKENHFLSGVSDSLSFVTKWNQLEDYVDNMLSDTQQNAIDILIRISQQLKNHQEFHYTNFHGEREGFKKICDDDLRKRVQFASEKISLNFVLGQQQHIYRQDISCEFVARSYARRMLDLHNPKIYPPKSLSFYTLYQFMFEDFILGISNQDGLRHFEEMSH